MFPQVINLQWSPTHPQQNVHVQPSEDSFFTRELSRTDVGELIRLRFISHQHHLHLHDGVDLKVKVIFGLQTMQMVLKCIVM